MVQLSALHLQNENMKKWKEDHDHRRSPRTSTNCYFSGSQSIYVVILPLTLQFYLKFEGRIEKTTVVAANAHLHLPIVLVKYRKLFMA